MIGLNSLIVTVPVCRTRGEVKFSSIMCNSIHWGFQSRDALEDIQPAMAPVFQDQPEKINFHFLKLVTIAGYPHDVPPSKKMSI